MNMNKISLRKISRISRRGRILILVVLISVVVFSIVVMGIATKKNDPSNSNKVSHQSEIELPTDTKEAPMPDGVKYWVSYDEVNLRMDPCIANDNIIGKLYKNEEVFVNEDIFRFCDGYRWVYVTSSRGNGWMVSESVFRYP